MPGHVLHGEKRLELPRFVILGWVVRASESPKPSARTPGAASRGGSRAEPHGWDCVWCQVPLPHLLVPGSWWERAVHHGDSPISKPPFSTTANRCSIMNGTDKINGSELGMSHCKAKKWPGHSALSPNIPGYHQNAPKVSESHGEIKRRHRVEPLPKRVQQQKIPRIRNISTTRQKSQFRDKP